jgi:hypothetical protein
MRIKYLITILGLLVVGLLQSVMAAGGLIAGLLFGLAIGAGVFRAGRPAHWDC